MPSTSCCPPCPGTDSRASRSRSAGTWAGPHGPGPSSCAASAIPATWPPAALAAWMVDHDTVAYYKIAHAFIDGEPSGNLTRDNVLDNITTYWLTGTGASAARSYWEAYGPDAPAAGLQPLPPPAIPFGFTTFPGEIWRTPRSWVEKSYPNVIYFDEVDRGRP